MDKNMKTNKIKEIKMENRKRELATQLRNPIMPVGSNSKDDESVDENESAHGTDNYGDSDLVGSHIPGKVGAPP